MSLQAGFSNADTSAETAADLARCLVCASPLWGRSACMACGRSYPVEDGLLHAIGPLTGTNRIAAAFYDSPAWARFRPWERLFLWFQGPGQQRARQQVLRNLPRLNTARVLEVGIGDGENLPLLPSDWIVHGVDIARTQLVACRDRFPPMAGRLVWAEAEALPYAAGTFDAAYSIGGFNYFRDQAAALAEMRRVVVDDGTIVVADESPELHRFAPGHALGFEWIDRWSLSLFGLDREFIAMVLDHRSDADAAARAVLPGHRRMPIWNRLGYCFVHHGPSGSL
jgi:SAM-dependent methyltransferase